MPEVIGNGKPVNDVYNDNEAQRFVAFARCYLEHRALPRTEFLARAGGGSPPAIIPMPALRKVPHRTFGPVRDDILKLTLLLPRTCVLC